MLTSFGPRAARIGLRPNDVIVAVDDWRVRTPDQYMMASRLKFDEQMTFTVWRDGRFQQLRLHVPQRWFGSGFRRYAGPPEQ
jgi:S1-C subfamily serine protease